MRVVGVSVAAALALTACVSDTEEFQRVRITGEVTAPDAADGPVWVEVHHAWMGEGALRYPMAFIAAFEQDGLGAYELTVDVPIDTGGQGLVVYAWQDRDGDGVLCALDGEVEPAGATEAAGWPDFSLTVDVRLGEACAGPEVLYP